MVDTTDEKRAPEVLVHILARGEFNDDMGECPYLLATSVVGAFAHRAMGPFGKLGYRESILDAANRIMYAETGISLNMNEAVQADAISQSFCVLADKHFINIFVRASVHQPERSKSSSSIDWNWESPEALPDNVFPPLLALIDDNSTTTVHVERF